MTQTIEVTQRHIRRASEEIERGTPREQCCPVALAMRESGLSGAEMYNGSIHLRGVDINPPDSVMNFVDDFDDDKPVSPFQFEFDDEDLLY